MKSRKMLPHSASLVAMLIWGCSFVWSKQVFETLQPGTTIMLRLVVSSIFLFALMLIKGDRIMPERADVKLFLLLAVFEPFLYFIGESYGLVRVSPTICSAIIATIPLFTPLAAFIFLKEKMSVWNIIGFIVSFIGVIVMLFDRDMEFTASVPGLLFLMGAVIVAVCYSMTLKKVASRYSPVLVVGVQNAIGAVYFIPFVLLAERQQLSNILLVGNYIVPLLMLGILASSLAYVFYVYAAKQIGIARSNVYTNLIPIFTVGFSYFIIHEEITLPKIIGIIVVITGLILSQTQKEQS